MNLKYLFGAALAVPLLPIMYLQAKRIRSTIPQLPEATGPEGNSKAKSNAGELKLLTIGESTVAGVGVATHDEGFSGTLGSELAQLVDRNISWKVYAKSGYTAKDVRNNLVPKINEKDVDLIVIGLGGNDAFTLNTPWRWRRDVTRLVETLRVKFPDTPITFSNMPPIKDFPAFTPLIKFIVGNLVEILGNELISVSKQNHNVHYYSDRITLAGWIKRFNLDLQEDDFFSDGVHPSKFTYQVLAKDVAQFIARNDIIHSK